ncbi:CAP-Gly domain-containing linker protein 1-like [Montipora capricornis]|uniref:CAP-Gly domain-containing linker protein 1-like n=1 Tax=Montipora capricornis TaxID=246305 RepID=UPI0035F11BBD
MYIDKDQQGYAMMQEQLSGQFAMESLLSDYKSLCREREDLLNSLQDSLDMDEEDILDELEHMNRENLQSVDMEGAQQAIQDTLRNIKSTTDKLQDMNKQMVTLTQKGERNEKLEEEKRQLERELKMYKKAAVQQRKEMFSRRSSIRKDQTQQWKLVAGEMVDMLNMVRNAGNLDRETLEQELNRILMTLNTQTECIDNLKRDLSKQEKAYKNLEKDKNRLNDDKTLVEDQLRAKQQELKQCKQYLRKVMAERKDAGEEKIKTAEDEIHLTESAEEVIPEDALTTDILKAQVRDARKLVLKLEEENKELQRKLAALSSSSEGNEEVQRILVVHQESTEPGTLEPNTEPVPVSALDECPRCHSYKEQIANQLQGFKSKEELIERLKRDLKKLRTLLLSIKDTSNVQSELAMIEEVKEERFEGPGSPEIKGNALMFCQPRYQGLSSLPPLSLGSTKEPTTRSLQLLCVRIKAFFTD